MRAAHREADETHLKLMWQAQQLAQSSHCAPFCHDRVCVNGVPQAHGFAGLDTRSSLTIATTRVFTSRIALRSPPELAFSPLADRDRTPRMVSLPDCATNAPRASFSPWPPVLCQYLQPICGYDVELSTDSHTCSITRPVCGRIEACKQKRS